MHIQLIPVGRVLLAASMTLVLMVPAPAAAEAEDTGVTRGLIAETDDYVLWTEHGLKRVPRQVEPDVLTALPSAAAAGVTMARNERESFQVVVSSRAEDALSFEGLAISALEGPGDARIDAAEISAHAVGYVNETHPDVLFPHDHFDDVLPGENFTLWLTVHVPPETPAGEYEGEVVLTLDGAEAAVPVRVRVWDFTLPPGTRVQTQLFTLHGPHIERMYPADEHDHEQLIRDGYDLYVERRFSPSHPVPRRLSSWQYPLPEVIEDDERGAVLACDGLGINVPASETLNAEQVTVSTWIKPRFEQTTWYPLIVKRHTAGDATGGFALTMQVHEAGQYRNDVARYIDWEVHTGGDEPVHVRANALPIMGQWTHLAATWDGQTARLYVNGEKVAAGEGSGAIVANDLPVGIGSWSERHDIVTQRTRNAVRGLIDQPRIYPRPLSAEEIVADMDAPEPVSSVALAESFADFDDSLSAIRDYLPTRHLMSHDTYDYYFAWAQWWVDRGLSIGRVPFRGTDPERAEAFFAVYIDELRRRGWLDRTWARLPGDEGYSHGSDRAIENIAAGLMWKRLAPDLRTHMTFNGLYWQHTNEQYKLDTLKDFARATDIYSINRGTYMPFRKLREFLADREVSWYHHWHMGIDQPAVEIRAFLWSMWQQDVDQTTLWRTNLWQRSDTDTRPAPRGFSYDSRWFGNATLLWPGERRILPSIRADLIRDGIEDWEYHRLLEQLFTRIVEEHEPRGREGVIPRDLYYDASYAIDVPGHIVDAGRSVTDDPAALLRQRREVAELILSLKELKETLENDQ